MNYDNIVEHNNKGGLNLMSVTSPLKFLLAMLGIGICL